jgi:hypothetical protein
MSTDGGSSASPAAVGGAFMTGCGTDTPSEGVDPNSATRPTPAGSRVLLAYFSRAGENYHYGGRKNLTIGNTEVLAGLIQMSGRSTPGYDASACYDPAPRRRR